MILVALGAAAGVVLVVALGRLAREDPPMFRAGEPPALTAPATMGRASDGGSIRLPSPAGRPAMVTFLFTECPDVCPLVASRIAAALDRAGSVAAGIDVVAITVDPAGDTPAAVRRFLRRHGLAGRMRYMVGTRAQLEPIWDAWGVAAQADGHGGEHGGRRSVHSAPVIFIDGAGRQVARFPPGVPYTAEDLESEIRALVA
jgi:protein SCO1/2